MIKAIRTSDAPAPAGTYSQAITTGSLVFTCGMGPKDPVTGQIPEGVAAQTRQVLRNLEAILRAAGTDLAHTVKTTVHLANVREDFAAFDQVYREFFQPPYPVRTTVGSTLQGILVEIDLVAAAPDGAGQG